ncbi:mannitol/fructose-specific phosphotransferase system IIA component (Ntr-type) [Enterococcus sp. PF1-24]|uniref:BglG family transcription antiterminator n=1 Tax=unclassified Enterococcus TaxID=2608891 RepID=UPI0024750F0A|nr:MULTISPECIES: PRD domain-containing protein [unclassified Enterococcus]MDH6363241.1 mannitol/fructose-specific phosphotransferase system IIA component (Ntr-type) [Enterococcus sp. PFB1-1]MDH6400458.1 mannitol/fructose-specific phosphotransferase system IIA component (Ntr-type) [Enterococcus sp. PF1-24]
MKKVLALTVQRIHSNHSLNQPIEHYVNTLEKTPEVDEFFYQIESDYQITLGQYDIDFLIFPLNISHANPIKIQEKAVRKIFDKMLNKIHETLILDLNDEQIFYEMKNHLFFMINRLVFRLRPADLFHGEIEKNYPFAYELAYTGMKVLEKYLKRKASNSEISYLAIYFELALRQHHKQTKKEIAIVCTTGRGTAALIRRQIENVLGPKVEIHQYTEEDYEKQDLDHFFAIFTTIPLKNIHPTTPVIQLTNLFNDEWLRSEWSRVNQVQQLKFDYVDFYFRRLDPAVEYQENLILLLDELVAENFVGETFPQNILEREAKNTTVFSHGVAFPHAIKENSDRILFSLGIFDTPRSTKDGEVELVFLVGIPEVITEKNEIELLQLYDAIFTFAAEDKNREEILKLESVQEFLTFLRRKEVFI